MAKKENRKIETETVETETVETETVETETVETETVETETVETGTVETPLYDNDLYSLVSQVAFHATDIQNASEAVKYTKQQTALLADKVINHFGQDHDSLCSFLTDTLQAMDDECLFGIRGNKTASGQDLVTGRMLATARFFHRSFNRRFNKDGIQLVKYNPFRVEPIKNKTALSTPDQLKEFCISINMDITAIDLCLTALEGSTIRAYNRQREAREAIRTEKNTKAKQAELRKRDRAFDALLDAGITAEQAALILKTAKQAA